MLSSRAVATSSESRKPLPRPVPSEPLKANVVGSLAVVGYFKTIEFVGDVKASPCECGQRSRDCIRISENLLGISPDRSHRGVHFVDVNAGCLERSFGPLEGETRHLRRVPGRNAGEDYCHRLLCGGARGVRVFHPVTTAELAHLLTPGGPPYSLEYCPEERQVWAGTSGAELYVFDMEKSEEIVHLNDAGRTEVDAIAFDRTRGLAFTGGCERCVRCWSKDLFTEVAPRLQFNDYTLAVEALPERNLLLVGWEGKISEFDLRKLPMKATGADGGSTIRGTTTQAVREFELHENGWIWRIEEAKSGFYGSSESSVAVDDSFFSVSDNGFVSKWNIDGSTVTSPKGPGTMYSCVYMSQYLDSDVVFHRKLAAEAADRVESILEKAMDVANCEVVQNDDVCAHIPYCFLVANGGIRGALIEASDDGDESDDDEESDEGVEPSPSSSSHPTYRVVLSGDIPLLPIDESALFLILAGVRDAAEVPPDDLLSFFLFFSALNLRRHAFVICQRLLKLGDRKALRRIVAAAAATAPPLSSVGTNLYDDGDGSVGPNSDLSTVSPFILACINALRDKAASADDAELGYLQSDLPDSLKFLSAPPPIPLRDHPFFNDVQATIDERLTFRALSKDTLLTLRKESADGTAAAPLRDAAADVLISTSVDEGCAKAHLAVLLLFSSFFYHMMHFSDEVSHEVTVSDLSIGALNAVLDTVYDVPMNENDTITLQALLSAFLHAHMYAEERLKDSLYRRILKKSKEIKADGVDEVRSECEAMLSENEEAFVRIVVFWDSLRGSLFDES